MKDEKKIEETSFSVKNNSVSLNQNHFFRNNYFRMLKKHLLSGIDFPKSRFNNCFFFYLLIFLRIQNIVILLKRVLPS